MLCNFNLGVKGYSVPGICSIQYKKFTFVSSNTTFVYNNRTYTVPCVLVPHLDELKQLITTTTVKNAILILLNQYGIYPRHTSIVRRTYNSVAPLQLPQAPRFNAMFKLAEYADIDHTLEANGTIMYQDARYIAMVTNDAQSFAFTLQDITNLSSYALSNIRNIPDFAIIQSTSSSLHAHTVFLLIHNGRIVAVPVIQPILLFIYDAYPENTAFRILFSGNTDTAHERMKELYLQSQESCSVLQRVNR